MAAQRRETGAHGEVLAARYLCKQGYKIVAKNWRCTEGELDLIGRQGEILVFVEVRTRRGTYLGAPEESITAAKKAKLIQLAYAFLASYDDPDCAWRIDVIAIVLDKRGRISRLNHIPYAVGE